MTREEAINIMKVIVHMLEEKYDTDRVEEAVDMAIKALELTDDKKELYSKGYKDGQEALAFHLELCKEEQEPCEDCIKIPKGATNGDMIKAMWNISDEDIDIGTYSVYVYIPKQIINGYDNRIVFYKDWWNSPYKRGE